MTKARPAPLLTDRAWRWIMGVLVALDILAAAVLGAHHGETFSHYANRHRDTWGGPVCAVLDAIDARHCARVTYFAAPPKPDMGEQP